LNDGQLAVELVKQAGEMLVIVGVQADDAVAAVEKLLALGMPKQDLAKTLQVVTGQRLIRRVCPKCSEDYPPAAEILARLKVPAREGLTFKRAAAGGCPACSGTGYLGRAAIVELAGGPTTSKAIAAGVDRATFVKAAQRDGMRRFGASGLAMVVAGVTTLEELQRILKKEKGQPG
jgi:type II secretory ATPase GspE/PulE/Tfp pilus assembly ATPase PilB-like protein